MLRFRQGPAVTGNAEGRALKLAGPPFVSARQCTVYTGAIRRKQETAKHSALQHATLTANQHYSTATQLRLVHKNTQEKRLDSGPQSLYKFT